MSYPIISPPPTSNILIMWFVNYFWQALKVSFFLSDVFSDFRIGPNTPPVIWVAHLTRHFLSCYSCSYYISMVKGNLLINPSFMENLPDLKLLIERFERDIQESCKCSLRRIADTKRLSHVTLKIRWLEILDNLDASLWIQSRKLWSQYW